MKNGKARSLDEVPLEVWKKKALNGNLLRLCNEVYYGNHIEAQNEGCILPLPRKGYLGIRDNYGEINVTSTAAKIYNTMILNTIQPAMETILSKNQNGFLKNRSATGQILTIRTIIEGARVLLFVDFSKALFVDYIHRAKLQEILLAYDYVSAIRMLYKYTEAYLRSQDGDTEYFVICFVICVKHFYAFYCLICKYYLNITFLPRSSTNRFLNFSDVYICFRFSVKIVLFNFVFNQT